LGGCRMSSGRYLPSGTQMELHIRPDQHAPVYVSRAIVQWAENLVLGVRFHDLGEIESATLNRLLYLLPSSRQS
jgi:hypothetical protein